MPWTRPMDQKRRLIQALERGEASMSELCRAFGIARKTGYYWWHRYQAEGEAGLVERSRAPVDRPTAVAPAVVEVLLELRRQRPRWGPKKLLAVLTPQWPTVRFPAASTVSRLLAREGLARPARRPRARPGDYTGPVTAGLAPNAVWGMDFQGGWRTTDGHWCTPFTASDACSRFLVRCTAARRTDFTLVHQELIAAFEAYGLPEALRSDNGPPFASAAPGGLSRLSVWLIKLGIRPERIRPGRPTENGRHERLHRTLEAETAHPRVRTRLAQQRVFDAFRQDYNEVRPHEALGQVPPAAVYQPSARRWPQALRDPAYPDAFECTRVRTDGSLKWMRHHVDVTPVLAGELVGLERGARESWRVYFGPVPLGVLDRRGRFRPLRRRRRVLPMS